MVIFMGEASGLCGNFLNSIAQYKAFGVALKFSSDRNPHRDIQGFKAVREHSLGILLMLQAETSGMLY